jgi:CheY-like chemotaxis protein
MAKAKILVVDDEQGMRELLSLHLGNAGYDVITAEDAIVAGHLVVSQKPDLMLVDMQMPYMNGDEFVTALRGDPSTRDIPVIFLSSDEDVSDRKLGAVAYLKKPVMADRLLEVVALFIAT